MTRVLAAVAAAALLSAPPPVFAQAPDAEHVEPVSWTVETTASSGYLWRGFVDIDRLNLRPTLSMSVGQLTVSSWMSWQGVNPGDPAIREHDLTVAYTRAVGPLSVTGSWTNYYFRATDDHRHSNEFAIAVSYEGIVQPTLAVNYDVQAGSGTYVAFSLSKPLRLSRRLTLTPRVETGYNDHFFIERSLVTHVETAAALEWQVTRRLTIEPFLSRSQSCDRSVVPNYTSGGVSMAIR